MAATVWSIVANWLVPIPLGLFLLMSLPLPRNIRRGTLIFTNRVFDLPVLGSFKLLHIVLFLTSLAFLSSARQVQLYHQQKDSVSFATPNMEIGFLSKRWRAERNLWLAAFAFTAWAFLAAYCREAGRRLDLESRLIDMERERSEFTTTEPGRDREREASVTSKAAEAAARDRSAAAGGSPNKTAAHPAAAADLVGSVPGGSRAAGGGGIQMQELKKDM